MKLNKTLMAIACCGANLLMQSAAPNEPASQQIAGGDTQEKWHSLDAIAEAAQSHIEATRGGTRANTQVAAARLDSRLRLAQCPVDLQTETPWAASRNGRVTVRVSCIAEPSWRVHVPVDVIVTAEVATSARALPRGAIVSEQDITMTRMELSSLGHGYFADLRHVVGQQLKRPLSPGAVLTPALLENPAVIRRGQSVTIVASGSGIAVKMQGTALGSGAIGQIIDIRNNSSDRRVQGVVRSARTVEILLR